MLEEWRIWIQAAFKEQMTGVCRKIPLLCFSNYRNTSACRDQVLPSWILGVLEEETTHTGFNPWQSPRSSSTTAPASGAGQIHEAGINHLMHLHCWITSIQKKKLWTKAKKFFAITEQLIEGKCVMEDKHFQVQTGPADRFNSFHKTPDCNSFYNCLYRQPSISIWTW